MKIWDSLLRKSHKAVIKPKQKEVYVLGYQLAKARERELQRKNEMNNVPSPMPKFKYSRREINWLLNLKQNQLDYDLFGIVKHFSTLNAIQRDDFRKSISMDEFYTLMVFSRRAAVFALRDNTHELSRASFEALAMIEIERIDERDISFGFGLLCHSARCIGLNIDEEANNAAELSEPNVRRIILGLANTYKEKPDLTKHWGFLEINTNDGPGFVRHDFNDYRPKNDLLRIALDIAEIMESDKYESDCPITGSKVPEVWLGEKASSVRKDLVSLVGVVNIGARLFSQYGEKASEQRIFVWLAEAKDDKTTARLVDAARSLQPKSYNLLVVSESNIFCLMVAKSVLVGLESVESKDSLKRFKIGIAKSIHKGLHTI